MRDEKFPWIDFPDNPKEGQLWVVRSKVMPTYATWKYTAATGWVCIRDD
jgi:hypothetical protein